MFKAVARGAVDARGVFPEDREIAPRSATWPAAGRGFADAPQTATIQFARLLPQGGALAEAIEVLERSEGEAALPLTIWPSRSAGRTRCRAIRARALEAYDLALTLQPQSIQALRQAAVVAERNNELERALSYWVRAKKGEPANPDILLGFGRVCLKMDLLEDAEPALIEAARLKPGDPAAQYTLAVAKVGKRQYEAAQSLFWSRSWRSSQRIRSCSTRWARSCTRRDVWTRPMARLNESVRLLPDQLGSPYYLALVARDQGRDADAIADARRCAPAPSRSRAIPRGAGRIAHERTAVR